MVSMATAGGCGASLRVRRCVGPLGRRSLGIRSGLRPGWWRSSGVRASDRGADEGGSGSGSDSGSTAASAASGSASGSSSGLSGSSLGLGQEFSDSLTLRREDEVAPEVERAGQARFVRRVALGSVHTLAVALPVSLTWELFDQSLFAWHPVLMSTGFLLMMAEGVMMARRQAAPGYAETHSEAERDEDTLLHVALQVCAVLCVLLGFVAIYSNQSALRRVHFATLHGKWGASVIAASLAAALLGGFPHALGHALRGKGAQVGDALKRLALVSIRIHKRAGTPLVLAGVLAIASGLQPFNPAHPVHQAHGLTLLWELLLAIFAYNFYVTQYLGSPRAPAAKAEADHSLST